MNESSRVFIKIWVSPKLWGMLENWWGLQLEFNCCIDCHRKQRKTMKISISSYSWAYNVQATYFRYSCLSHWGSVSFKFQQRIPLSLNTYRRWNVQRAPPYSFAAFNVFLSASNSPNINHWICYRPQILWTPFWAETLSNVAGSIHWNS